jgi:outer membrane protein
MSRLLWIASLAAVAALLNGLPASAQEEGGQGKTYFGRTLSTHMLLGLAPDYIGSDDYEPVPAGSLSLSTPGAEVIFTAPDDGVSVGLVGGKAFSAGLLGRWLPDRGADGDLRGFDKIDWAVEAGGFAIWWPADWLRLRGELRRGFGGHTSWAANLGADAVYREGSWVVSIGPRVRWADDEFTRTYFRVTPLEAARSPFGINAYEPKGDFLSAGAIGSVEYRWNRRWSLTADAEYQRLTGDAADSPIVSRLGSEDQFSANIGVRYTFGQ